MSSSCAPLNVVIIALAIVLFLSASKKAELRQEVKTLKMNIELMEDAPEVKYRAACGKMGGKIRIGQDDLNQLVMACDIPVRP